jgi:hypothetical protein
VGLDVTVAGEKFETDTTSVLVPNVDPRQLWVVVVFLILVRLKHHPALDGLVTVSTGVRSVLKLKDDIRSLDNQLS